VKSIRLSICILISGIILISCGNPKTPGQSKSDSAETVETDTSKPLRTVRLLPYWVPSAQFAGYYVGIEKGIFKKHGINLDLLPFDPLTPTATVFKEGKTDFAILWLVNALELKGQGIDIVNIAQFSSRSSLMLITKKSSGISKLEDMNGKRAGIWVGYETQPRALFKKFNMNVEIVPIGSTNNLFLQDGVDILNANWFDEYHSVINNGINEDELNTFFFADYGFNFLEDGVYCQPDLVRTNPELCKDFVEATLESWDYAFKHQEEAIEIVVKYATKLNQPVNISHQEWMLSHFQKLYIPEGRTTINTNLLQKDFDHVQEILMESKLLTKAFPYDSFYQPQVRNN